MLLLRPKGMSDPAGISWAVTHDLLSLVWVRHESAERDDL